MDTDGGGKRRDPTAIAVMERVKEVEAGRTGVPDGAGADHGGALQRRAQGYYMVSKRDLMAGMRVRVRASGR
jgi:hypothetical protein